MYLELQYAKINTRMNLAYALKSVKTEADFNEMPN